MQQENFDLETESGSFPPLSETPNNHTTTAPPLNLSEEGASNLADIVKGKRQKDMPILMNGNGMPALPNGLADRLSSKVVSSPNKAAQPSLQQQQQHSPTLHAAQLSRPQQQKQEPKVGTVWAHMYTRVQVGMGARVQAYMACVHMYDTQ